MPGSEEKLRDLVSSVSEAHRHPSGEHADSELTLRSSPQRPREKPPVSVGKTGADALGKEIAKLSDTKAALDIIAMDWDKLSLKKDRSGPFKFKAASEIKRFVEKRMQDIKSSREKMVVASNNVFVTRAVDDYARELSGLEILPSLIEEFQGKSEQPWDQFVQDYRAGCEEKLGQTAKRLLPPVLLPSVEVVDRKLTTSSEICETLIARAKQVPELVAAYNFHTLMFAYQHAESDSSTHYYVVLTVPNKKVEAPAEPDPDVVEALAEPDPNVVEAPAEPDPNEEEAPAEPVPENTKEVRMKREWSQEELTGLDGAFILNAHSHGSDQFLPVAEISQLMLPHVPESRGNCANGELKLLKSVEGVKFFLVDCELNQGTVPVSESSGDATPPVSGDATPPVSGDATPPVSGDVTPPASGAAAYSLAWFGEAVSRRLHEALNITLSS